MRNASAAKKEGNGIKKRKSKQERRFFLLGLLFVSPWLIGFLCFQLYPILSALYYSFTDFNIFQPAEFTGLDNYVTLFNDKYFPVSIKNTAVMSFIGMPIGLVVALALAVLLSKEVKGMPDSVIEAARIDGANEFVILYRVVYPMCKPVLTTIMVLVFIGGWNDLNGPLLYLQDSAKYTLSIGLQMFLTTARQEWDLLMAAGVMFTLPLIIIFFLAQKQFISGISTTSGLK